MKEHREHRRRRTDPNDVDFTGARNGIVAMLGRIGLQLIVPFLAAGFASWVAVKSQLVRLEERVEGVRSEVQLRDGFLQANVGELKSRLSQHEAKPH